MKTTTIAQQLQPSKINFEELHEKYRPMLKLVRELIGVIPNCDQFLEIWPVGFRSYNLVVPNLINLPFSLFGFGAPKALVGLAMYISSREADCAYCTAHCCSFAIRRGSSTESLTGETRSSCEESVASVAKSLARIPSDLNNAQVANLAHHFSPGDVEWIVLSIGMMGFLNKFMDAMGIELEAECIADVGEMLEATGWKPGKHGGAKGTIQAVLGGPMIDNLGTYWRVICQAPSAISIENHWVKGVPDRWPEVGEFLLNHTGHNFPLLSKLSHKRAIRALVTILRDNLDPKTTEIGLTTKSLAGLVFSVVVGNKILKEEAQLMATHYCAELDENLLEDIEQFAKKALVEDCDEIKKSLEEISSHPDLSREDAACIHLARAASTSPAQISKTILSEITPILKPAQIIELMVWLSIQQLMHRLNCFYNAVDTA